MRYGTIGLIVALMSLSGCGVEMLTTTATQGAATAVQMQAMEAQTKKAADRTGRINLERAISVYRAEKGVPPPSLEVLAPDYIPSVPIHSDGTPYQYNPVTGELAPDGPATMPAAGAAGDTQTMQAIREAINKYGTATGYYPPTLDSLYPTYLSTLPRTSTGQQFTYNNQNGEIALPGQAPAAAPRQTVPSGVGGAGPMGEVMTGVGMQQQLGNMSNSGSSAAQGYANRNIGDTTSAHNDQQNQVMDQLGL